MATVHTPTGVTIDGILIDGNRITKPEYLRIIASLTETEAKGADASMDDVMKRQEFTGELAGKIIVHWPFDAPISKDGYLALGLLDSMRVDQALTEFCLSLAEKKSTLPLKQPEATNGQSTTLS